MDNTPIGHETMDETTCCTPGQGSAITTRAKLESITAPLLAINSAMI